MFKAADIYNAKTALCRDILDSFTFIQALLQNLHREAWHCEYLKNQLNRVTHLFFMKNILKKLLKINLKILIMNCIYKINRFKLSLLVIFEVTALNIRFYIVFVFMLHEIAIDYIWMLKQLKAVYWRLNLHDSEVNIINRDFELILALHQVFSTTRHILCIWHIDKNVLANCKDQFVIEKNWNNFQQIKLHCSCSKKLYWHRVQIWHQVTYVFIEAIYETVWNSLQETYKSHSKTIQYLHEIWIDSYKRKFIKCYTNRILHFNNNAISRSEDDHAVLKRNLRFNTDDLKKIVDCIELMLLNQRNDYLIVFDEIKMRLTHDLWLSIFRDLHAQITLFALRRILSQWRLLASIATALPRCTNSFTTSMRLSCAYWIQAQIYSETFYILKLKNIHSYWRFIKSARIVSESKITSNIFIDSLLLVQNSPIARTRDRSVDATAAAARTRTEQELDDST